MVLLEFLINSNSHSVFKFEAKIKFITVTVTNTLAYSAGASLLKNKVL
jgi:hypothetical protein